VLSGISWFGDSGPYAEFSGSDGVCQALIGLVRGIGPEQGPPVMPAGYQAQIVGGLTAYIGTLGQVFARELGNTEAPCRLETSIFEANLCFTDAGLVGFSYTGVAGRRMGVNRFPPTFPLGIYPCKDGWIGVTALTPSQWRAFCALLDLNDLVDFASYQTTVGRLADAAYLEPIIVQRVAARSAHELFDRGQRMRIPLALVPATEQLLQVDQYVERGAFGTVTHPSQGSFAAPVTPFRLYRTPATAGGAAPFLGADTRTCLTACGVTSAEIVTFAAKHVIGEP
jgi:crotonobetainyl-CoA:carnitine CoA-transferase CaiB-like acyl-CoA transferase